MRCCVGRDVNSAPPMSHSTAIPFPSLNTARPLSLAEKRDDAQ